MLFSLLFKWFSFRCKKVISLFYSWNFFSFFLYQIMFNITLQLHNDEKFMLRHCLVLFCFNIFFWLTLKKACYYCSTTQHVRFLIRSNLRYAVMWIVVFITSIQLAMELRFGRRYCHINLFLIESLVACCPLEGE